MDWADILWVCSLWYLILPYLLSFCITAPKRLHQLNSNLLITIPHKPLNVFSWNFVSMFLIVPWLLSFCVTAPKHLRRLNSNLEDTIPSKPLYGLSWNFVGMIFWIFSCTLSTTFCVTAPKRPSRLNSNLVDITPPTLLNGLSWNSSTVQQNELTFLECTS